MSPAAKAAVEAHTEMTAAQVTANAAAARRREAVVALRAEGWSFQQIADLLGVAKTAVAKLLRSS